MDTLLNYNDGCLLGRGVASLFLKEPFSYSSYVLWCRLLFTSESIARTEQ